MKISCCIDMMFSYLDFYERFSAVKKCGINTVEFWKWTDKDICKVKKMLSKYNMGVSIFNLDSCDDKLSYDLSRGILNAGRTDDFLRALDESIPIYKELDASAMIVLIGENEPFNSENVYKTLLKAAPTVEKEAVNLIVEPLNATDRAGYSMPYAGPVFDVLRRVGSPNIKLLYDIYHQNMTGDFSMEDIKNNIDIIGHFHVADAPGRHEPGSGTVDYIGILNEIEKLSYDGYFGLEYRATRHDEETLGFLKEVS